VALRNTKTEDGRNRFSLPPGPGQRPHHPARFFAINTSHSGERQKVGMVRLAPPFGPIRRDRVFCEKPSQQCSKFVGVHRKNQHGSRSRRKRRSLYGRIGFGPSMKVPKSAQPDHVLFNAAGWVARRPLFLKECLLDGAEKIDRSPERGRSKKRTPLG